MEIKCQLEGLFFASSVAAFVAFKKSKETMQLKNVLPYATTSSLSCPSSNSSFSPLQTPVCATIFAQFEPKRFEDTLVPVSSSEGGPRYPLAE